MQSNINWQQRYNELQDVCMKEKAALQAKCERYEKVLKGMVKKVHSRHITDGDNRLANELCNEANEALSAGEGEEEVGNA